MGWMMMYTGWEGQRKREVMGTTDWLIWSLKGQLKGEEDNRYYISEGICFL